LLFTHEELTACTKPQGGEGSSAHGDGSGSSKGHGKVTKKKSSKSLLGRDQCWRCGKTGHWARECPVPRKAPKAEAHLTVTDDGEVTLLMATLCMLHDIEPVAEEAATRTEVSGHSIFLDESCAQVR
jgi:hypothetical protein